MASTSTLRKLVADALEDRGTNLNEFVAKGRSEGKSVKSIATDLAFITGIPLSWRTLYRWVNEDDQERAS